MASISIDQNGNRAIQFVASDGKRRTVRLGKMSKRVTEEIKVRIEHLAAAQRSGLPVDGETASWLSKIGGDLADKLAAVGLTPRRKDREAALLDAFLEQYIASRTDHKKGTSINCQVTQKCMVAFFGADKPLQDITSADADDYALHLRTLGLSEATIGRRIKRCRQFFRAAQRRKLLLDNPFADVKAPAQTNESRKVYISRAIIDKVIEAAPNAEWRVIIVLARYAGLRTPSETFTLRWEDINWDRGRMLVHSPKTEHLPNGDTRIVPLFPEVRDALWELWEQTEPGAEFVITKYRNPAQNLRTQFLRIIRRAGEKPWVKPFHNLRASLETELMERFPAHVVCRWIGNTEVVALRHYLTTTEAHFEQAAQSAAESGAVAVQFPVQQDAATIRTVSQEMAESGVACGVVREVAEGRKPLPDKKLTLTGFEPVSRP